MMLSDNAHLRHEGVRLLCFDRLYLRPERVSSDEGVIIHVLDKATDSLADKGAYPPREAQTLLHDDVVVCSL